MMRIQVGRFLLTRPVVKAEGNCMYFGVDTILGREVVLQCIQYKQNNIQEILKLIRNTRVIQEEQPDGFLEILDMQLDQDALWIAFDYDNTVCLAELEQSVSNEDIQKLQTIFNQANQLNIDPYRLNSENVFRNQQNGAIFVACVGHLPETASSPHIARGNSIDLAQILNQQSTLQLFFDNDPAVQIKKPGLLTLKDPLYVSLLQFMQLSIERPNEVTLPTMASVLSSTLQELNHLPDGFHLLTPETVFIDLRTGQVTIIQKRTMDEMQIQACRDENKYAGFLPPRILNGEPISMFCHSWQIAILFMSLTRIDGYSIFGGGCVEQTITSVTSQEIVQSLNVESCLQRVYNLCSDAIRVPYDCGDMAKQANKLCDEIKNATGSEFKIVDNIKAEDNVEEVTELRDAVKTLQKQLQDMAKIYEKNLETQRQKVAALKVENATLVSQLTNHVDLDQRTIEKIQRNPDYVKDLENRVLELQTDVADLKQSLQEQRNLLAQAGERIAQEVNRQEFVHEPNLHECACGSKSLVDAAACGCQECLDFYLPEAGARDHSTLGLSALMKAVQAGRVNAVEKLKDFEMHMKDRRGSTALMYAAMLGNFQMVQLLVQEAGVANLENETALLNALWNSTYSKERKQIVNLLLQSESEIRVSQISQLMLACLDLSPKKLNANMNQTAVVDLLGNPALFYAVKSGFVQAVDKLMPFEQLLKNERGQTALHLAVQEKSQSLVIKLAKGVNGQSAIGSKDNDEKSALQYAAELGYKNCFMTLKAYQLEVQTMGSTKVQRAEIKLRQLK